MYYHLFDSLFFLNLTTDWKTIGSADVVHTYTQFNRDRYKWIRGF